ncbi:MAG TPA: carboxypeptidase regulatory-like domain-containing protein [Gemmatimonadales bacterium]
MSRGPLSAAVACGVALLAAAPGGLRAQAVVKGRLLSQQARHPLADAEVVIQELKRSAATDDSGYFRLAGVPLGVHEVLFRRIGFVPAYATLRVEAADSVTLEILMEAVVPELETIIVTAPRVTASRMTAFLDRMRTGQGKYLTPAQLRSREMDQLSDILREKGVRVVPDPRAFAEYAYGRSGRGRRCPMRVVLDGLDLRGDLGAPADLRRVEVRRLEAMEIYLSETTAPAEFGGPGPNSCGLLVLWTRPR